MFDQVSLVFALIPFKFHRFMIAKIINYYVRSLIYKGFCQRYKPKEKTPTRSHWGSKLLAGVHLSEKGSTTTNPKKSKSRLVQTPCQVSESPELT
jgi:putative transposase